MYGICKPTQNKSDTKIFIKNWRFLQKTLDANKAMQVILQGLIPII
ncbi:hypothetical protein HMPREF3216_00416 [Gardnerella vaginalis]|uniref:Uncharacterized protein n=1 Tax=Gardnerella vaginalis TaxID=2702 RepID=A0A133NQC3_GARVA|nr:hypothetical protein HMPREF3216_00416 [Gardnerella vaginalis]